MPDRLRWLTPDSLAGTDVVRTTTVPAVLLPYLAGALGELTNPDNWEQFGTVTIDDAVAAMESMLNAWYESG